MSQLDKGHAASLDNRVLLEVQDMGGSCWSAASHVTHKPGEHLFDVGTSFALGHLFSGGFEGKGKMSAPILGVPKL